MKKTSLLDWFHHWELTQPQATFLTQPANGEVIDYSWAQVGDQARRMAAHLKSLALPRRSSIGILSKNCAHWVMADLAIWMAGHVSVPLYPTLNAQAAAQVIEHARVRLLFLGKLDAPDWETLRAGIPASLEQIALPLSPPCPGREWRDIVNRIDPLADAPRRKPDELATIIYTSGSTGKPKGVRTCFAAMLAAPEGLGQIIEVSPRDRMLSYLPLAHAAERAAVEALALRHGLRLYFSESLSTFMEDLRRAQPTIFFSVPRLWIRFQQAIAQKLPPRRQAVLFRTPVVGAIVRRKLLRELGLDHARVAITGAAALPESTQAWFRELGLELLEAYGMSENFCYSHFSRPGQVRVGTVGQPAPGVQCRIDDAGQVRVHSPCNMLGYHRSPKQTREVLDADGWLQTGDRGRIDADGMLRITGRVKDLFKTSKGKYVAPVPIENRLMRHPAVEAACVAGQGLPQPYVLAMLGDGAEETRRELLERELAELLDEVNSELEPHEVLDFMVVVRAPWTIANGLLTPTLKIRRDRIEAQYAGRVGEWASRRRKVVRE